MPNSGSVRCLHACDVLLCHMARPLDSGLSTAEGQGPALKIAATCGAALRPAKVRLDVRLGRRKFRAVLWEVPRCRIRLPFPEQPEAAPKGQQHSRSGQFPEYGPELRRPNRKFKRTLAGHIRGTALKVYPGSILGMPGGPNFGVWPAPRAGETILKSGGLRPPPF